MSEGEADWVLRKKRREETRRAALVPTALRFQLKTEVKEGAERREVSRAGPTDTSVPVPNNSASRSESECMDNVSDARSLFRGIRRRRWRCPALASPFPLRPTEI